MKYLVYDVCVSDQKDSNWIDANKLGVPLDKKEWLSMLKREIEVYCECYESDDYELTKEQFIMNMMEALECRPIQINGIEFIQEVE